MTRAWEGRPLVSLGNGLVGVLALCVLVWLGYFVVEVARRLDVWPF